MKNKTHKILLSFLVCCCMLIFNQGIAFQATEKSEETATEYVFTWGGRTVWGVQDSKKEEIHRYMGYELLLPKYLSLPYDVGMNTNIKGGVFIDIGYLFVMFLPIILIFGMKNTSLRLGTIFLLLLFLIISNVTGYSSFFNIPVSEMKVNLDTQIAANTFTDTPLLVLKLIITKGVYFLYEPINTFFQIVSGEGDFLTFPMLLVIFVLSYYLLTQRLKVSNLAIKAICFLMFLYCFFWWILGAGIVWYGILMIVMGLVLISIAVLQNRINTIDNKFLKYTFFTTATLWIVMAISFRFANYDYSLNKEMKKGAINSSSMIYGMGKMDDNQIMNLLYSGYKPALDKINANTNTLVYRAGTFLHYFIEKNNERVMEDNQLAFFDRVSARVPDKIELAKVFKKNGYRYLVIDLNLASIDLTPDKSLTKKTKNLFNFVNSNPLIRLIATDRVTNGQQVQKNGSFAVFEII